MVVKLAAGIEAERRFPIPSTDIENDPEGYMLPAVRAIQQASFIEGAVWNAEHGISEFSDEPLNSEKRHIAFCPYDGAPLMRDEWESPLPGLWICTKCGGKYQEGDNDA